MTRITALIITLLFSVAVHAQIKIAGKPFPEQWKVIDSIGQVISKDSTITLDEAYQKIIQEAIDANDQELEMFLQLRSLQNAYNNKEISDSRFITTLRSYTKKCIKKGWKHLAAIGYNFEADHWNKTGVKSEALKYSLKAYDQFKNLDPDFYIHKKASIIRIGQAYARFEDPANALKYFYIAKEIPSKFDAALINGIALVYMHSGKYDSALYYFNELYKGSVENNNKVYAMLAQTNKVGVYMSQERYDTALAIILDYLPHAENKMNTKHIGAEYDRIGFLYLMLNNPKEADKYLNRSLQKFRSLSPQWYYQFPEYGARMFKHAAMTKAALKQFQIAYMYSDSAQMASDTLHKLFNTVELKNIEKELSKSKLDYFNQSLLYKQKEVEQQRNLWILTIIAATTIILFLIYRQRVRKQKLEYERDMAEVELKTSQDKLSDFTKSIYEKNKLLEQLQKDINSYETNEQTNEHSKAIIELQEATILTDADWVDFKRTFEKAHPGFISRLKNKHPSLTQAESRYIILTKLGMSTKEMASVLGVSAGSIRTQKSRLIKRLDMSSEEELNEMMNAI